MLATTIDGVILCLESILEECIKTNNKAGYFVALYINATTKIKAAIEKDEFEDGARMARLSTAFGNRLFAEWDKWKNKEQTNRSWDAVILAGQRNDILVIQQLLLGINVHINLDLGVSIVEIMKGECLADIHNDFNKVNTLFAELTQKAINDVARSSKLFTMMGLNATKSNIAVVNFLIENARDSAWLFAEQLAVKSGKDYQNCIDKQDAKVRNLSDSIIMKTSGVTKYTLAFVRMFEYKSPTTVMKYIRSGVNKKPLLRAAF